MEVIDAEVVGTEVAGFVAAVVTGAVDVAGAEDVVGAVVDGVVDADGEAVDAQPVSKMVTINISARGMKILRENIFLLLFVIQPVCLS